MEIQQFWCPEPVPTANDSFMGMAYRHWRLLISTIIALVEGGVRSCPTLEHLDSREEVPCWSPKNKKNTSAAKLLLYSSF